MVLVFILGLVVSSLLERRAEVVSIYNNRKHLFTDSIVYRLAEGEVRRRLPTRVSVLGKDRRHDLPG